jgi:hypothetical protein
MGDAVKHRKSSPDGVELRLNGEPWKKDRDSSDSSSSSDTSENEDGEAWEAMNKIGDTLQALDDEREEGDESEEESKGKRDKRTKAAQKKKERKEKSAKAKGVDKKDGSRSPRKDLPHKGKKSDSSSNNGALFFSYYKLQYPYLFNIYFFYRAQVTAKRHPVQEEHAPLPPIRHQAPHPSFKL